MDNPMAHTKNLRYLGGIDIPGGGQVEVRGSYAYVGHMKPPHGTTILDVSDPRAPRVVAQLEVPPHTHSHKVRVMGDLMLVNLERYTRFTGDASGFVGGLEIYDASDVRNPRKIGFFPVANTRGVHRFDVDDRYAYLSAEMDGFLGNILIVVDLADPTRPQEVGRWWCPGQHVAGGETPTWQGKDVRIHHGLRRGDRLYVSCWLGGMAIVDATDVSRLRTIGTLQWQKSYPNPTHTVLPLPDPYRGRRFALVADEDINVPPPDQPAFLWVVDITDETQPVPVATYQVPFESVERVEGRFGCHQPQEQTYAGDSVIAVTWTSGGLRLVDVSNPYQPREAGWFVPDRGKDEPAAQTNDVYVTAEGMVYVIDRLKGLDILERLE